MIANNECCSKDDQTDKLNYLFETSSLLPSDLIDYPNQIGGHGLLFGNKSKILYSHVQSTIYKPIQHYPKGPHELEFYQHLFDPNCCDTTLIELRQFVPDFYGLYRDSERKHLYLGLKDLLANFKNPSLCDLKMGCRTYAPDSSPSKVMIECAKYKWREEIGFLVTGLKVFYPDINEHNTYDIFFGRSLNPSTIYDNGIRLFLGPDINRAQKLAHKFVKKLTQLANWFENQTCYHFYASSLLLAYDSISTNDEKKGVLYPEFSSSSSSHFQHHQCNNSYEVSRKTSSTTTVEGETVTDEDEVEYVLVYLIDFTRWEMVTNCQIKDENFLYGLNYLIKLFERASIDSSPLQNGPSISTT
uniref:Kinase n=1 Tax=Schistosoma japonicum TaxID=6182 RepID=Q5D967_SCHJA|nr:SJCHGC09077 protein [Schistosoma japonicum]